MDVVAAGLERIRYRIELDLTARDDGARGCTEVRFGWTEPGAATVVLAGAAATRVTLNGRDLPSPAAQDGRIELSDLQAENVLTVKSELDYCAGGHGLCSVTSEGDRYVYLSLGPSTATPVIPCFIRAGPTAFDLRVRAPAGWSVTSHTAPIARPEPGAAGEWRFLVSLPRDARVLTFAAGPWAVVESRAASSSRPGRCGSKLCGPRASDLVRASSIPGDLVRVLDYFERSLGLAYPYDQADCVAVPDYGSQPRRNGSTDPSAARRSHQPVVIPLSITGRIRSIPRSSWPGGDGRRGSPCRNRGGRERAPDRRAHRSR